MEEKEVSAELGIWAPVAMTNKIHVLGSRRVCQAWYFLKCEFFTPCRFADTRSTAMIRSSCVRKLAVVGRSGRNRMVKMPITVLAEPKMRKTYIQRGRPVVMCPTA